MLDRADSDGGQYKGSQAFSHIVPGRNESINPNTGSLNFTKPLVQLRGITSSIDINISLSYNAGSAGAYGLPRNWSIDLPYVVPGQTITFSGRTYAIDEFWNDAEGHQSGLRYLNNHGIKFSQIIPPQLLPTDQSQEYSYKLQLQDGSTEFFDALGRPLARLDLFGNSLQYFYLQGPSGGILDPEPCLDYILDSWGQKIQFAYQEGLEMVVIGPSHTETTIAFSGQGVSVITDPLGYATAFVYTASVTDEQVISTIAYATGLTSRFDYTAIQFLDNNNTARYLPAVSDYYQLDANGRTLKHTNYRFGSESAGLTFTGAGVGCQLSGLKDNLMDSNHTSYRYDVLVTNLDENGKILSATLSWFSNLHLPLTEWQYLVSDQGDLQAAYSTEYRYNIDPDLHARSTNYALPHTIVYLHNTSDSDINWKGLRQFTMTYTSYGQLLSQDEEVSGSSGFIKTKTTKRDYFTVEGLGLQMLKTETLTDVTGGTTRETHNALSVDQKTIERSTVFFKAQGDSTTKPWKTNSKEFDAKGRVTRETSSWADGAFVPGGGARSCFSATEFHFTDGVLTLSRSDSSTGTAVSSFDMRISGGPVTRIVLPLGQAEHFEYDHIGRLIKHTDALGDITTKSYSISISSNAETVVDPRGLIVRTTFDALGRPIYVADNGDPTQPEGSLEPTRVIQRMGYDCLGQLVSSTDIVGLVTSQTFDALGRSLKTTDPAGNVSSNVYDDAGLIVRQEVNGNLRKEIRMDGYGRATRQTVFADSADDHIKYCYAQEVYYNGSGQTVKEAVSQQQISGPPPTNPFKTQVTTYDADSNIESQITTGVGDTGEAVISREFTRDLWGNTYTWTKQTRYSDGRTFINQGSVTLFDMHGNPTFLRNQLGQEERNTYDENGWLATTARFDGTTFAYAYDNCGQVTDVRWPSGSNVTNYSYRGQVKSVKQGTATVSFEYFKDGSVRSVDYGEGHVQRFERDAASRVRVESDVFTTRKQIHYDQLGRVESVTCQGDVLSFHYGTANHQVGMLVGSSLASSSKPYHQEFEYDGFGARSKVRTSASDSTVLLETSYKMNERRRLASVTSTASRPLAHKITYSWLYDGVGQITKETETSGGAAQVREFLYDGNFNVVRTIADDKITITTYNALDQRTDPGFCYEPNGRLVRDNRGLQYAFDELDHLTGVQLVDGSKSRFGYHGDGTLATIARPQEKTDFYYSQQQKVNAVAHEDGGSGKQTSSVLQNAGSVIAAYSPNAAAPPTYFLEQNGSTAIQLRGEECTSISYQAYGASTSSTLLSPQGQFNFRQELSDSTSGLVYLRSRFYQPSNMAFISMDSYHMENRYAYCQGDPINYFDPSGHISIRAIVGLVVGTVAGAIAGIASAGAAIPIVEAGLLTVGMSEATLASTTGVFLTQSIAGAAAGMTTNVLNHTVGNMVAGGSYGWADFGQDLATGAAGGFVAGGLGPLVESGTLTPWLAGTADFAVQNAVSWGFFSPPSIDASTIAGAVLNVFVGAIIGRSATVRRRRLALDAETNDLNNAIELVNTQLPEFLRGQLVDRNSRRVQDWASLKQLSSIKRRKPLSLAVISESCRASFGDPWLRGKPDRDDPGGGPGYMQLL
ncbi:hypothetical protein CcaCcLH18_04853 [Colletotrichum camelliae]|nr:hypothetical protein CcaCcLH18_04853 [Colletotrichum camelliae]